MKRTATFIKVLDIWSARTLIFKAKPKLQNDKYIVVVAADAIDHWEMIIWSADKVEKHYDNLVFREVRGYKTLCCPSLPDWKKALSLIGYTMVGGPRRFPR